MKTKTAWEKEENGFHKGDEDQNGLGNKGNGLHPCNEDQNGIKIRGEWSSPKKEYETCPLREQKRRTFGMFFS
ncbi:hypothetical protein [Metabacillus litoralis]|uniref:hypothetical protein n=1 Tax=Metabacillus litoralis TaxID=152268 RepID=UPI0020422B7C|nr:hypothetical protein [Metabacillus litoralis]MCM3165085.1 hypothetical protein [Metabacillus litoralis]